MIGELHRAGRILRGDPHAYDDLIEQLQQAWDDLDNELEDYLPEEFDNAGYPDSPS